MCLTVRGTPIQHPPQFFATKGTRIGYLGKTEIQMETNAIKSTSLLSLVKAGVVRNISAVRSNKNGYLYVTLLNGSKATNVYFGRKTSEKFAAGQVITAAELKEAIIVQSVNQAGESRLKFSLSSTGSNYQDLGAAFGIVMPSVSDEDADVIAMVANEMHAVEEPATTN